MAKSMHSVKRKIDLYRFISYTIRRHSKNKGIGLQNNYETAKSPHIQQFWCTIK